MRLMHTLAVSAAALCLLTAGPALACDEEEGKHHAKQAKSADLQWDLSQPKYNPPNTPAWAKVDVPERIKPYVGKNGLPKPWGDSKGPLGSSAAGIDRYQANQFVVHREETAQYIYSEYTPADAGYVQGTLPAYEKIVDKYTNDEMSDTEKAIALLTEAMPNVFRHPSMPPLGGKAAADRDLLDTALLKTGSGWCNEQARVFIRLCQIAGMQGRIVHLFGQNHTIAEFYADGQWVLADASNFFVARDEEGNLLSAADCHDGGAGQLAYAKAKQQRMHELASMSDKELGYDNSERAGKFRANARNFDAEKLANRDDIVFAVINYPVPPSPSQAQR